ncbi:MULTISPECIES: helix-turn-helix domain-containing protein [unclassified Nostoc]|uniref:helix-turn-helix domain-containing protein n=1 Tax=unclassified Nostoc TaxID=2593658 RepID=UPI002AD48FC6|nr:helix-turn-helix domain-containing protein [Nostoc sp. DedQUE03]MDZ7975217.1 helix-turn-helix domain-containing protein [Nostoc sp. DedQUE03]MDZ8048833.1 helix-turn-helix domain-containing protein [Nostoc sp. DedQUE02]
MKEGSKYQPLLEFLCGSEQNEISLSFAEIETLINDVLPESARNKQAWWSNRKQGSSQAYAWMEAGYRVENVDFDQQQVIFRKPPDKYQVELQGDTVLWNAELIKALRQHMDLTQAEFAQRLGVRQATVSQWEKSVYEPTLATSKYLTLIAKQAGFKI